MAQNERKGFFSRLFNRDNQKNEEKQLQQEKQIEQESDTPPLQVAAS